MSNRILIVDDEPEVSASLSRLTRRNGFRPEVASGVNEALALQAKDPFPVIITDYRMPGRSGDELAKDVKARWPNTVVIVISAFTDFDNVVKILNDQLAFRFLVKPWDNEQMIKELVLAVQQHDERRYAEFANQLFHDSDQPLFEFDASFNLLRTNSIARAMDREFMLFNIFNDREAIEQLTRQDDALAESVKHYFPGNRIATLQLLFNGDQRKLFSAKLQDKQSFSSPIKLSHDDLYAIIDYLLPTNNPFLVSLIRIANANDIIEDQGLEHFFRVCDICQTKLTDALLEHEYCGIYEQGIFYYICVKQDDEALTHRMEAITSMLCTFMQQMAEESLQATHLLARAYYLTSHTPVKSRGELLSKLLATYHYHSENTKNLTFRFNPLINNSYSSEFAISKALFYAVDNKELELVFQAKWSNRQHRIAGAEILLRWNNPEIGIMGPDDFVTIAERDGQIIKIEEWVIKQAFEQINQWHKEGFNAAPYSLNISGRHLADRQFVAFLQKSLTQSQAKASDFILEINETSLTDRGDHALPILKELKALGFNLSIDDFGTSYSNLTYLKSLPVNELKIDRSFIMDCHKNESAQLMLQNIVNMAHDLNVNVVAEGIENQEQFTILGAMGCDYAQGYYISKPLQGPEFKIFIESKR